MCGCGVAVAVAHSRPKSRRRAWKCPGECQMHYAQILGRRRPPHRKSRYRCASGAVTGRFPDLNRGFRNASQSPEKGSRTVPYSHLISAISLTHLFNGRGPLHRWRRPPSVQPAPRSAPRSAPVAPKETKCLQRLSDVPQLRRTHTMHATRDVRPTRSHSPARLGAKISTQKSHGYIGGRPPQRPGHEASSAQSSCEPTKPPPQPPRAGTPLGATTPHAWPSGAQDVWQRGDSRRTTA